MYGEVRREAADTCGALEASKHRKKSMSGVMLGDRCRCLYEYGLSLVSRIGMMSRIARAVLCAGMPHCVAYLPCSQRSCFEASVPDTIICRYGCGKRQPTFEYNGTR